MSRKLHGDTPDALAYVYENSLRARLFKRQTKKLVNEALWEIHDMPPRNKIYMQKGDMVSHIEARIKVGSPLIITFIMQILVGIIVKLIVDWWWSNRR